MLQTFEPIASQQPAQPRRGAVRARPVAPARVATALGAATGEALPPTLVVEGVRREPRGALPWILSGSVAVHALALLWAQGLPGPMRADVEPALQWVAAITMDVRLPKSEPLPVAKLEPQVEAPAPAVRPPAPRPLRRPQTAATPPSQTPPAQTAPIHSPPPSAAAPPAAQVAIAIGGPGTVAVPVAPADEGAPVRADAPPSALVAPTAKGVPDGEGLDWGGYNARLRAKIVQRRRYPTEAEEAGWQGTVLVRVQVARDGTLAGEPEVLRSSGFGALDREALRMVRAAAPFAPLPGGFEGAAREVQLPIEFVLDDSDF